MNVYLGHFQSKVTANVTATKTPPTTVLSFADRKIIRTSTMPSSVWVLAELRVGVIQKRHDTGTSWHDDASLQVMYVEST